jgi:hypothetical protein
MGTLHFNWIKNEKDAYNGLVSTDISNTLDLTAPTMVY